MAKKKSASGPEGSRPHIPGYGIPKSRKGLLAWSFVDERLTKARNYWVCTTRPDGRPHARAVWGVWVDGAVCFGGGAEVRWARNLARNPALVVHLESGDEVVILEGSAERVTDAKDPLVARVQDAYRAKYNMPHPPPFWVLRPQVAFGWTLKQFPKSATRWLLAKPQRYPARHERQKQAASFPHRQKPLG